MFGVVISIFNIVYFRSYCKFVELKRGFGCCKCLENCERVRNWHDERFTLWNLYYHLFYDDFISGVRLGNYWTRASEIFYNISAPSSLEIFPFEHLWKALHILEALSCFLWNNKTIMISLEAMKKEFAIAEITRGKLRWKLKIACWAIVFGCKCYKHFAWKCSAAETFERSDSIRIFISFHAFGSFFVCFS